MLAGRYNFVIEQGQDWYRQIAWRDSSSTVKDLSSGYSAALKIRPYPGHTGTEIDSFSSVSEINLSDGTSGANIIVDVAGATTAAYDFLRGWYTLEVTNTGTGEISRVLEGYVHLSKEATN